MINSKFSQTSENLKQQYEQNPYPDVRIEQSFKNAYPNLYLNNLVTSYYLRNHKVINTKDKIILDVACGSGCTTLMLAQANPDAQIIGIDFSPNSIEVAKKRLNYHGFNQVEFHIMELEKVGQLNIKFDYINCSDILYFLDDLVSSLKILKSVLKPEGILHGNLHSKYMRRYFYLAQELCKIMGLMDDTPSEVEIEFIREFMKAVKDDTTLKRMTWSADLEKNDLSLLMNYLIVNDHGYTIPKMFEVLDHAQLEFISMTNWRDWDLKKLFKQPDDLPDVIEYCLDQASEKEKLAFCELLHPQSRLLDFWCGHRDQAHSFLPVSQWKDSDWHNVKIYLHPQLKQEDWRQKIIEEIKLHHSIEICPFLPMAGQTLTLESNLVSVLLPLWETPQSLESLIKRYLTINPLDCVSLEPISPKEATDKIKSILITLEDWGYILLDRY